LFNAVIKQKTDVRKITENFDSVSLCLSKGLGAPVGSILCGTRTFIAEARKWRKMAGGWMRQAGILAAAGIFALENNIERLETDHNNARLLAEGLARHKQLEVTYVEAQTNMVFFSLAKPLVGNFGPFMAERDIIIGDGPDSIRAVTHYGLEAADIDAVVRAAAECSRRYLS